MAPETTLEQRRCTGRGQRTQVRLFEALVQEIGVYAWRAIPTSRSPVRFGD